MLNTNKGLIARQRRNRNGAILLSLLLVGGCTSITVPDALNPTKWDFFSDAPSEVAVEGENQGLAGDSEAPAPAASTAAADGGLSGDSSAVYASDAIARQDAPRDVLSASSDAPTSAPLTSQVAVTPERPMPAQAPAPAPVPTTAVKMAEAPPPPAAIAPRPVIQPAPVPKTSTLQAPSAPQLRLRQPANAMAPTRDTFETIVITSDGIEDQRPSVIVAPQAQAPATSIAPTSSAGSNVRFPQPGATTSGTPAPISVGGMLRVATIYFANNSAALDAREGDILSAVAQLHRERGGRVMVVGHASSRTADMEYVKHAMTNFQISLGRANSVAAGLRSRGVAEDNVRVHAVSDTVPLYFEVMPSGEAGNRRVEIYLAP